MRFLAALLLALLLAGGAAHADSLVVATCGTLPLAYAPGAVRNDTVDVNGNKCIAGTITATATSVVAAQSTLPTLAPGNQTATASLAGAAYVQSVFGSATGGGTQVDATHGLPVNCIVGCAGGSFNNNSDAVPTSATNGQTAAWLYGFNGTTWDRLRVDPSKNLDVNISANSFGTLTVAGTVTANQGGTWTLSQGCAGQSIANTLVKPISATGSVALVAGVAAKKVYVCAIDLVVGAADNVALVEGTTVTTPCDTGTAGMAGGATAATGWNFAANGGLSKGSGIGLLYVTATAADNVCLLVSGAAQVSGTITYAQF